MNRKLLLFALLLFFGCKESESTDPIEQPKHFVIKEKLFFSSGPDDHINISMMDTNGQNVVQITHYSEGEYHGAGISPDGKKILYYRFDESTLANGIFVKDLYAKDPTTPLDYGFGCDFTPDGQSIIYAKHIWAIDGGNDAIFRYNLKDNSIVRLTTDDNHNDQPRVSPDGNKIAFVTWRPIDPADTNVFSHWDIMLMNIDGSQQEFLLQPRYGDYSACPSFSHDGSLIAFSTGNRLRRFDLKTRSITDLITMRESIHRLYPAFSLLDDNIYFVAGDWHHSAIYVVDGNGKGLHQLTDKTYNNRHPFVARVAVSE